MLQNRLFVALASRPPGFGAAISDAIARSSIVFCNSVSADRIVVAASRLLGAAAACVILLSFAAEDRKSYWNGCIKAAKVICQQIFSIFPFKIPFKKCFKIVFLSLWRRLLGAAAACVILLSFAAEDRKSYWNGCIKAAKVICQQIFSILVQCEVWGKCLHSTGVARRSCSWTATLQQLRTKHARTGLAGARRMQVP